MRPQPGDLLLIRHAPADHGGRLCGRIDPPAILPAADTLSGLRAHLARCRVVCSPARRCVETARAVYGSDAVETDVRLWEQDFGTFDGCAFGDLPDLGAMSRAGLAAHRWPDGESFDDMARRVAPALRDLIAAARAGPVAVVAHAGTVRAALGRALGAPSHGLAFEVAPLSVTRFRCWEDGLAIQGVGLPPAAFA